MIKRIGINGFGRMGRLVFRVLANQTGLQVVRVNDPGADAATMAHLVNFDSIHGPWQKTLNVAENHLELEGQEIFFSRQTSIENTDWSDCDLVIEASGKFRKKEALQAYLAQGVKHVLVTAPVKEEGVANIVMGVNDQQFDFEVTPIVTAASCTTNSLAPIVKVIDAALGIRHGSLTTIHALTNTQSILDSPHKDLRRARACSMSMIPTTTGSATAITHIFPHLKGKLNGHAVRVPLTCPSLTDCVLELATETSPEEVNQLFKTASQTPDLNGILDVEDRPLVSIDYKTNAHSCVIDSLSTMVVNGTQLKVYAWYDNEWGYVNRTAELAALILR